MATRSGRTRRSARFSVVAASTNPILRKHLSSAFTEEAALVSRWPFPGPAATDVLVLDLAITWTAGWSDLVRLSRQRTRPAILLVDHHQVSREMLARVVVDELLPVDVDPAVLVRSVTRHARLSAFRSAAALVEADGRFPYPLNRFLGAALVDGAGRVGRLANAYGFRQSTLRNQWRACRPDRTLRLEDILKEAARLHAGAETTSASDMRFALDVLVRHIVDSTDPSCALKPTDP